MKLHIVPRSEVEHTLQANRQPELGLEARHNTHFHTLDEVQAVLPHHTHTPPASQPWILFDPFIELIADSQGLDPNDVHTITLPSRFLTMVEQCGTSGVLLQTLSSSALEDLEETFPRTTNEGEPIRELFLASRVGMGYFARTSTCSLKDSFYRPSKQGSNAVSQGSGPVTEMQQLWQRIATSGRATAGIKDLRAAGLEVKLFLLPWNDEIKPQREYRVFCAPNGGMVSAVSQYRWFDPWVHYRGGEDGITSMEEKTQNVLRGILTVHQKLLRYSELRGSGIIQTGFTFDVIERQDGLVALLELNDFGAMTGCGSCLFHWINDAKTLYRAHGYDEIEFRVLAG